MAEETISGRLSYERIITAIRTAIYGKNVREAIAQGIEHCHGLSINAEEQYQTAFEAEALAEKTLREAIEIKTSVETTAEEVKHINVNISKSEGVVHISITNREGKTFTETIMDPGTMVNDTVIAENRLWSSAKIDEELSALAAYEKIGINSFSANPSTAEVGSTIRTVNLNYALTKAAKIIKIDGEAVPNTDQSGTIIKNGTWAGSTPQKSYSFVIAVTDERDYSPGTKTASLIFQNRVYYGAAENPSTLNEAFVKGLTKIFDGNSRKRTISMTANNERYLYYAVPRRLGACTFTVGGFSGGFHLAGTIAVTNDSGYTEEYYVYQSDNKNLGATSVVVT